MEKQEALPKGKEQDVKQSRQEEAAKQGRKYSKTWEAAMRLKGSLIVNDPKFLL